MERVTHQDCSLMKYLNLDGTDLEDISMTQKNSHTHSPMVTKIAHLSLKLILQLQKVEKNSRKNGMQLLKWLQSFSPKKTWFTLMNKLNISLTSLITKEYGNIIESTSSSLDIHIS